MELRKNSKQRQRHCQRKVLEAGKYHSQIERGGISRGGHYGGRNSFLGGRGRGRGG
jgi:hypothetical protein